MPRPKKRDTMETAVKEAEEAVSIQDMPLTSLREYKAYNEAARAANKKARKLVHPIKQCPVDLHPKDRIVFGRNDQPENPLKVFVSNDLIHYQETLIPGRTYDVPRCIVHYLAEKGTPVWKWRDLPDGSKETFYDHKVPRFALRTVYAD